MAKVGFISLGCPKNLVDSEVMIGLLRKQGHSLITDASKADVIVINTCSFIEESRRESIETILNAAELKKVGSCKRLIVTGCLSERYPKEMKSDLGEVDVILGINQIEEITRAVSEDPVSPPNSFGRSDVDLYLYDHKTPRTLITPPYTAYIKISEGCDHTCSFCIIPMIRGRFRSRNIASLVRETEQLVSQGVKEITLISQDTTSYGLDFGLQDGLPRLLETLEKVEGLRWIRFLYAYPNLISDRLIEAVAGSKKICKYIDMPLQHCNADILRSMRRGGNRASLTRMIEEIRKKVPELTFRTTMITGFPGESEKDFKELKKFCQEMQFDRLGVFAYSDEENTAAFRLKDKISARTAERRRRILMEQQTAISARRNRELVGKELTVLIEGTSRESNLLLQGRLESQAPEIDGICLINDSQIRKVKCGEFRTIRITQALEHDLLGTIIR